MTISKSNSALIPTPNSTKKLNPIERAQFVQAAVRKYGTAICACYLEIGGLLKEAKDNRHWDVLGFDGWVDYTADLGLTIDQASKMIGIVEYVIPLPFVKTTEPDVIKWSTMIRLLPIARKGELTEEMWREAVLLSEADLRRMLGHSVTTPEGAEVTCPQCGARFKPWQKVEGGG